MKSLARFAENQDEFDLVRAKIAKLCVSSPSLPTWPFRVSGNVYTYNFLTAPSPEFGAVLQYIASEVGDENFDILGILGWGRGEAIEYSGVYPAFSIGAESIEDAYKVAMRLDREITRDGTTYRTLCLKESRLVATRSRGASMATAIGT